MERFWNTVRMPNAVPHFLELTSSCTVSGTDGQITAATMLHAKHTQAPLSQRKRGYHRTSSTPERGMRPLKSACDDPENVIE
jgi:hypothetical protein